MRWGFRRRGLGLLVFYFFFFGLCVVGSDSEVLRDIYYDNHVVSEKCCVVLRAAPTFFRFCEGVFSIFRFGSFEIFNAENPVRQGPSAGYEIPLLYQMLDYVIQYHFSHIWENDDLEHEEKYLAFYKEVVGLTAETVALWQCVGFAHGVLNTDNTSILGLTIDYGPFGFLDIYDPYFICNGSGRTMNIVSFLK